MNEIVIFSFFFLRNNKSGWKEKLRVMKVKIANEAKTSQEIMNFCLLSKKYQFSIQFNSTFHEKILCKCSFRCKVNKKSCLTLPSPSTVKSHIYD